MSLRLARVCAEQFLGNEIRMGAQGPGQKMFSIDPVIHGAFSLQIISHAPHGLIISTNSVTHQNC